MLSETTQSIETQNTWSLVLDYAEILALAGLMRVDPWPGLALPENTQQTELQQIIEQGFTGLAEKQLLAADPANGGRPVLFNGLAHFVKSVQKPWITLALFPSESNLSRWIFIRPDRLVEQEMLTGGRVRLTAVQSLDVLKERVQAYLALDVQTPAGAQSFTLNPAVIEDPEMPTDHKLIQAGAPADAAALLLAVLTGKRQYQRFIVADPINPTVAAQSLTWLSGPAGCWQVTETTAPDGQGQWNFQSVTAAEIQAQILAWLVQPSEE